jgi:hypothetical protein
MSLKWMGASKYPLKVEAGKEDKWGVSFRAS